MSRGSIRDNQGPRAEHRGTSAMRPDQLFDRSHALQRGLVTRGGGMTVCLYILPKLLRKFRAEYKAVDLRIITGTSDTIVRLLRSREIDVALLTLPIVAADLEVIPVMKEEMVVVCAGRHPLEIGRASCRERV